MRAMYLPLVAALLRRSAQPAGVLGAVPVNTSATEQAAQAPLEYHPPPDVPKVLELACSDQRFVALALSNWTAVGSNLAAAFAKIAAVPATRFALLSEMQSAPAYIAPGQPVRKPLTLLQQRAPVLYFFQVDISPGRAGECPCPCIPGTPAAQVATALLAALNAQAVDGFSFAARYGGLWKGTATFPPPAVVPAPTRATPHYAAGPAPLTAEQAWAFSNATRGVVDDFVGEQEASMMRAAEALGKAQKAQLPCTRTNGGLPGPCISPGKVSAEVPQDQQGYPQKLPWTDPITYEEGVAPIV